jgi:hypothetical protein
MPRRRSHRPKTPSTAACVRFMSMIHENFFEVCIAIIFPRACFQLARNHCALFMLFATRA